MNERGVKLSNWLAGNGARTPEEKALAGKFGGPNAEVAATRAISSARKKHLQTFVSGGGRQSRHERDLSSRFGGKNADLLATIAIALRRQTSRRDFLPEEFIDS